jgi:hypothetical protein
VSGEERQAPGNPCHTIYGSKRLTRSIVIERKIENALEKPSTDTEKERIIYRWGDEFKTHDFRWLERNKRSLTRKRRQAFVRL